MVNRFELVVCMYAHTTMQPIQFTIALVRDIVYVVWILIWTKLFISNFSQRLFLPSLFALKSNWSTGNATSMQFYFLGAVSCFGNDAVIVVVIILVACMIRTISIAHIEIDDTKGILQYIKQYSQVLRFIIPRKIYLVDRSSTEFIFEW